ncbi:MAG: hypothetical protein ACYC4Q_04730 [Victivallaceae bacterium]
MKKLKPYKITKTAILYRVKTAAGVDRRMFAAAEWPADKSLLCFDFKSIKLNPAKPPKFAVPGKYCHRVACYSPGRGIKNPGQPCPAAGISARAPKSLAELRRISRKHFFAYARGFRNRLGTEFCKVYPEYDRVYLPKVKALVLEKNGKDVGLYTHTPLTGVAGKRLDNMCWHSLVPGLSKAERASAHYQAALWLKETTKLQVAVSFDLVDKEAYEFFSGLGFTTCRAIFQRRRK